MRFFLLVVDQFSHRGKYRLRLYDIVDRVWKRITVDDWIPAHHGDPLFSKPTASEIWVQLLEKAFAKMGKSYANIESGHMVWALKSTLKFLLCDRNCDVCADVFHLLPWPHQLQR